MPMHREPDFLTQLAPQRDSQAGSTEGPPLPRAACLGFVVGSRGPASAGWLSAPASVSSQRPPPSPWTGGEASSSSALATRRVSCTRIVSCGVLP